MSASTSPLVPRAALPLALAMAAPVFAQEMQAQTPPDVESAASAATDAPVAPTTASAPGVSSTSLEVRVADSATPATMAEPATPEAIVATDGAAAQAANAATGAPLAQATAADPASSPTDSASAESTPRTDAEADFDALYGDADADGPAARPAAYDPWERYNRQMHRFNNAVDRRVARPLAQAYVRAVPTPVRSGVSNFFNNLGQPVSAINALLQGRPKQAAHSLGRFVLNSTLGIGGVLDPASAAKLDNRSEDFGQTLGVWGWRRSRYVELPLFGPRTLRDVLGMAGDAPLSPLRQVDADRIRVPLQGMQLVDLRSQLLSTDALRENVEDDYALVRDAWSQRRDYQIMGDRTDGPAPDDQPEDRTVVPVDAMPVPIN